MKNEIIINGATYRLVKSCSVDDCKGCAFVTKCDRDKHICNDVFGYELAKGNHLELEYECKR